MADAAAPASSPTGVSADGGVPPASALLQSHAAKQDLGDADDTGIGTLPYLLTARSHPESVAPELHDAYCDVGGFVSSW